MKLHFWGAFWAKKPLKLLSTFFVDCSRYLVLLNLGHETSHTEPVYSTLWTSPMKSYSEFITGINNFHSGHYFKNVIMRKISFFSDFLTSLLNLSVAIIWPLSTLINELVPGSGDGMVKWWDIRSLSKPLDTLVMDPEHGSGDQAESVSCMEFEPSIPIRFMVGTNQGNVYGCFRWISDLDFKKFIINSQISRLKL